MTGYGKSELEINNKKLIIEIKSLNSKQLDINLKLSNSFREKELEIRKILKKLERGKVEFYINIESLESELSVSINKPSFLAYYNQIKEIGNELDIKTSELTINNILKLPDVLQNKKNVLDENEWENLKTQIDLAILNLNKFREQEGSALEKDIELRINKILNLLSEVDAPEENRIEKIKERIKNNFNNFLTEKNIDENRFEQELIYYIEKIDITEEKTRLRNHCNYFLKNIKTTAPVGKKLGFISQEIGREINTLGSKANDSDLQKIVIKMKDELEKIKEQLLNIL